MMAAWKKFSPREQWLIAVMAIVATLIAVWQFVAVPLVDYRQAARSDYVAAQALYREMEVGAARAALQAAVDEGGKPRAATNVRAAVSTTARQRGIIVSRLQPAQNGGLNIWVDAITPVDLMGWLAGLNADYGVVVSKATLRKNEQLPSLRAQLLFVSQGA